MPAKCGGDDGSTCPGRKDIDVGGGSRGKAADTGDATSEKLEGVECQGATGADGVDAETCDLEAEGV